MFLKSIRLSGFKSFLETTTLDLRPGILSVVGPNGCGKSNIVDAVRWVIGEHRASRLRTTTMADVIFHGSANHKTLSRASVELIFDNADSALGGRYADYAELSVRRDINRDGESHYYLNQSLCRRADITDVFLGTGLGGNRYAIVEQGMVAQLAQSKPEEMYALLEEAAGVSRYRVKRRETELKIDRCRANLQRVTDSQLEANQRMKELRAQMRQTEKHEKFKERLTLLTAQDLGVQLLTVRQSLYTLQAACAEFTLRVQQLEKKQEANKADAEVLQKNYSNAVGLHTDAQKQFYQHQQQVNGLEKDLKTRELRQSEYSNEIQILQTDEITEQGLVEKATIDLKEATALMAKQQPELNKKRSQRKALQDALDSAEARWEVVQNKYESDLAVSSKQDAEHAGLEVEHNQCLSKAKQLDAAIVQLEEEEKHLRHTLKSLTVADGASIDYASIESKANQAKDTVDRARETELASESALQSIDEKLQELRGRIDRLVGSGNSNLQSIKNKLRNLNQADWSDSNLLIEDLRIESGWHTACMLVLSEHLGALCVEEMPAKLDNFLTLMQGEQSSGLVLTNTPPNTKPAKHGIWLSSVISAPKTLDVLLRGVMAVKTTKEALAAYADLALGESIVSRDGVWVGHGFVRFLSSEAKQIKDLPNLQQALDKITLEHKQVDKAHDQAKKSVVVALEQERQASADLVHAVTEKGRHFARAEQQKQAELRLETIARDLSRESLLSKELKQQEQDLSKRLAEYAKQVMGMKRALEQTQSERVLSKEKVEQARTQLRDFDKLSRDLELSEATLTARITGLEENILRGRERLSQFSDRMRVMLDRVADNDKSVDETKKKLQEVLSQHKIAQADMDKALAYVTACEEERKTHTKSSNAIETELANQRGLNQSSQSELQDKDLRSNLLAEQITALDVDCEQLLTELPKGTVSEDLIKKIKGVEKRINDLGAINMAAASNYKDMHEHKTFLETQQEDVVLSLQNLEEAKQHIDKESNKQYKDTLLILNKLLPNYFKSLFGGGTAEIISKKEESGAGAVYLKVRLPGKHHCDLEQLSGGEKTLVAVALMFTFFAHNPAPFCILDEVDAALDDTNINRFNALLRSVASDLQLICITHNKTTMQASDYLLGVTMREAGVSQIVGVDLSAAEAMVSDNNRQVAKQ